LKFRRILKGWGFWEEFNRRVNWLVKEKVLLKTKGILEEENPFQFKEWEAPFMRFGNNLTF